MIKARVLESSRKSKLMMQNLIGTSVGTGAADCGRCEGVDDTPDLFTKSIEKLDSLPPRGST